MYISFLTTQGSNCPQGLYGIPHFLSLDSLPLLPPSYPTQYSLSQRWSTDTQENSLWLRLQLFVMATDHIQISTPPPTTTNNAIVYKGNCWEGSSWITESMNKQRNKYTLTLTEQYVSDTVLSIFRFSYLLFTISLWGRFYCFLSFSSFKYSIYLFLERGERKEREGEKHQCVVASHVPPTGDLAHSPGMSPD